MIQPKWPSGVRRDTVLIWVAVIAFVLALTIHADVSRANLDRHGDMVENYAWGTLWQWGYYKHPPFFAWLTAAWFEIFPKIDANYFLFSAVNAGVALLAVWRIAARYGDGKMQLLAVYCAAVIPPVAFLAIKYNANSAMTPIWAWLFVFYLRGIEKRKLADAVMLGLLSGIAMLTKYHSAVILATLLAHAAWDKETRSVLLSLFGAVTLGVFLVIMAPHAYWLFNNEFLPFVYAASQGDGLWADVFFSIGKFLVALPLYGVPALLIALLMHHDPKLLRWPTYLAGLRRLTHSVKGRALLAVCVGPTVLTVLLGIAAAADLSAGWGIPFFPPLAVLVAYLVPDALRHRNMHRANIAFAIYLAAMVAIAPILGRMERDVDISNQDVPIANLAHAMDDIWSRQGDARPGFYVAGEVFLANGMSFYSKYAPVIVEGNSLDYSKGYMSRTDLLRRGGMAACLKSDTLCQDEVRRIMPATVSPEPLVVKGLNGVSDWNFVVWVLPPST